MANESPFTHAAFKPGRAEPVADQPAFNDDEAAPETPPVSAPPRSAPPHAALARRRDTDVAGTGESLPVLEAFQEFLETERRLTRTRMLALTAVFAGILVTVVAVGLVVGMSYYGRMREDYVRVQNDLHALTLEALRDKTTTFATLTQVSDQTRQLRESMEQDRRVLTATQTDATSQLDRYTQELTALRRSLAQATTPPPAPAPTVTPATDPALQAVRADLERTRAEIAQLRAGVRPERDPMTPRAVLTIGLTPEDADYELTWRMPLPP